MLHIRVSPGKKSVYYPRVHTSVLWSTLFMLSGARVWSVPDESCVRESVLPGFIRVCLVKGVQTRTSAAFIKITDTWCWPDKCRVYASPCQPVFVLNEREMTIRVDCRARCSAKLTLIECRGNLDWYGYIHIIRYIMGRARSKGDVAIRN